MVQLARHHDLFQDHQRRQRHHRIALAAHKNFLDVQGRIAVLGIGLHHHVVLLAIALELGHHATTHGGFHGPRNRVHRHAHIGGTLAVDFHADLGFVQTQVHVHAQDARVLGHFILHGFGDLGQVFITVVGQHHEIQRTLAKRLAE